MEIMRQLIFINTQQHDTAWADFFILDVMSIDNFSAKRIAYTAAELCWKPNSDVVLMAINQIQRDLNCGNHLVVSVVLSSIHSFLSQALAKQISGDVIQLMNSSKAYIRQKAIIIFLSVCLKTPEALRPGFQTLQSHLNDDDISVVYATLTVICELCKINPRNFVPFIPRLCKMLESTTVDAISLKLLELMRMLSVVEIRLPKKLVLPLTTVMETSSSMIVLLECIKTILGMPQVIPKLISLVSFKIQSFLQNTDPNYKYASLSYFIQLMKSFPKLIPQNKEIIGDLLKSDNEIEAVLALDLISSLVNSKNIDSIVGMLYQQFKNSSILPFRNKMFSRVIEICSNNDYELITDFDWYISVLVDFIEEGNFTCFTDLSNQLIDLVTRVPDTRKRITDEMCHLFDSPSNMNLTELILTALHIIGEYSPDSEPFSKVLQPIIANCDDRVQSSCISTAFILYLKAETTEEMIDLENLFKMKLPMFQQSEYIEVQERAYSILALVEICQTIHDKEGFHDLKNYIFNTENLEPIEIPKDELSLPNPIFKKESQNKTVKRKHHKKKPKKLAFDDIKEDKKEEETEKEKESKPKNFDPLISRCIRRKEKRHHNRNQNQNIVDLALPVSGPLPTAREKLVGSNTSLSVILTKVVPCDKNQLEITIQINNTSTSNIPSIGFTLTETKYIKIKNLEDLTISICPNTSIYHSFTISVEGHLVPQIVKLLVIPNGCDVDSIETRIIIFPSYFLKPVDKSLIENIKDKCIFSENIELESKVEKRNIIQNLANLLQANTVYDEDKIQLIAASHFSDYFYCILDFNSQNIKIQLCSSNELYAKTLIKEIKINLK